jgi:hypothetical protein
LTYPHLSFNILRYSLRRIGRILIRHDRYYLFLITIPAYLLKGSKRRYIIAEIALSVGVKSVFLRVIDGNGFNFPRVVEETSGTSCDLAWVSRKIFLEGRLE